MQQFQAIAAMAENRVIGKGNTIPWHLPDDFKWFKAKTMGHILIMGRKTFESIGRPLPGRETIILSRSGYSVPGIQTVESLTCLEGTLGDDKRIPFICGGAEIYRQTLDLCSDLYLTQVKGFFEGDAFFPEFENHFKDAEAVLQHEQFTVFHYHRR
jgi:dihydrofolate reductase